MSVDANASAAAPATELAKTSGAVRIAYLCGQYPAVSHTFVLREVDSLRKAGAQIETFSIRRAPAEHLLADADRAAFETTYAILPQPPLRLLAAHLRLLLGAPAAYLSTLALALKLAPGGVRGWVWQLFYFAEAVVMWQQCRRRGLRHVHAHLANVAADVALLTAHIGSRAGRQGQWTWSFTMHGPTEFFDVGRYRLAQKVRHAHFVVCISDYARSQLMTLTDPCEWSKLHVVHVGIPVEQFTAAGASPALRGSTAALPRSAAALRGSTDGDEATGVDAAILSIGRLVPDKGQAVLLQAVAVLAHRGHRLAVTLAGEGPARVALENLAADLGICEEVHFPGAVGQDRIHRLYAAADVFCLSSFAEGVPCVLMEAMAMELPVVSTGVAGIPELIDDGETGLLVAPGRPDLLADAIESLLSDASLARQMGRRASAKVIEEFNAETSAAQLHRLFAQMLVCADDAARPAYAR
jgi:colanic acid/amylovoran biosynthesis glycosyltransferase